MRTEKEVLEQVKHFERLINKSPDKFSRDYLKLVARKQALEWVLDIE